MTNVYVLHLETTVVDDCVEIMCSCTPSPTATYLFAESQLNDLESYVGPRIARLTLRRTGFQPLGSGDWVRGSGKPEPLHEFYAVEFGVALADLDPSALLTPHLGIAA